MNPAKRYQNWSKATGRFCQVLSIEGAKTMVQTCKGYHTL